MFKVVRDATDPQKTESENILIVMLQYSNRNLSIISKYKSKAVRVKYIMDLWLNKLIFFLLY